MNEDELRLLFPRCFNNARLPLMRGIHKGLKLPYPSQVLEHWTNNPQYLRNMLAENATRIDPEGNVAGEVTFAEKERAWFILHDLRNKIYKWRSMHMRNPVRARLPLSTAEAAAEIKRSLPKMPKRQE
jgi:sRNA-binding protein